MHGFTVLTSKDEAKQLYTSEECPTNEKGRKVGIVNLTLKFWKEKGYGNLGKTAQNLRDKLAHLERTCEVNALCITNELQEQRETTEQRPNNRELADEEQMCQSNEQQQRIDWTIEDLNWISQITQMAKCTYDEIVPDTGNMDKRDVNTFFKNTAFIKKIDIDRLQYVAKTLITAKPSIDPLQYLWEYNCTIYSVVKAWKLTNAKKRNEDKQQKFDGKPRWMIRIEGKMNTLRKQVSQICEELKRVRENRHLTPKMKKNRSWMITEIKGRITIASLTILKERKINTIRALKRQKEKRKIAHKRFKINQWFDVAEGSFYSHLNNIIKSTKLNKHPQFISKEKMPSANQESTSKTTRGDFEEFWRPIWENASEVPIQAE